MNIEIKAKLEKSPAFASLQMEEKIKEILLSIGWNVSHSAYYQDPKENKQREIDIVGRMMGRTEDSSFLSLYLPIECKSLDGCHIIFSKTHERYLQFHMTGLCSWVGYMPYHNRMKIYNALSEIGYRRKQINDVLHQIHSSAYPEEHVRIWRLMVRPFSEIHSATSFREMTVSTEKSLENSVLWRAILTLNSVIESMKKEAEDDFVKSILNSGIYALSQDEQNISDFLSSIDDGTKRVSLYHPIVVSNAKLWQNIGGSLQEVGSCRLYLHDTDGEVSKWYDVVNIEYIDDYLKQITQYYRYEAECVCDKLL